MVVSGGFLAVKKAVKCTTNFVHAGVGVESAIFDHVSDSVSVAGWGKDVIAFADHYGYVDAEPHAAPVRVQAGGSTTTFSSPPFQLSAGDVSLRILLGQSNGPKDEEKDLT